MLERAAASPLRVELVQIARRLCLTGHKVIGLWPAGTLVPVTTLGVCLAAAMHEVSGRSIALLDGNDRWPATSIADDPADPGELAFVSRRLSDGVALIAARRPPPRAGMPHLQRLVGAHLDLFAHILIDLSGYDCTGDHLAAFAIADVVVLAARRGVTTENELLAMHAQLSEARSLGVILVGGHD